jgi:hypothetical protein
LQSNWTRNGHKIKLIKFYVDKELRTLIKEKYRAEGDINNSDNDSIFVIATNLISLTCDDMIILYKYRWNIEVCNKYIKSNFNLRSIVKQQKSLNPIDKISFYTSLSILFYNLTMLEKKLMEKRYYVKYNKQTNLNYSKSIITYKQFLIDNINYRKNKPVITKSIKEHRALLNKTSRSKKKTIIRKKKKGKYKSLQTIAKNNNRFDILQQIEQYYKLMKQIKKNRQYTQYGG